jgi:ABC-2 type transport system ATP-binding protein
MRKLGKKQLTLELATALPRVPAELEGPHLELAADGTKLVYSFDAKAQETGIAELLRKLGEHGIVFKDLNTTESSLEDIFVSLVKGPSRGPGASEKRNGP